MSDQHTPEVDRVLKAAFRDYCRRTDMRFAPYMGSVDDAYRVWLADHPEEVEAALAKEQP